MAGGRTSSSGNLNFLEVYDPVADEWTGEDGTMCTPSTHKHFSSELSAMPTPRGGIAGAAVGDYIVVFGGEGSQIIPATEGNFEVDRRR